MKRIFFLTTLAILATSIIKAQTYFTRNGVVSFYSKTPVETIQAENKQALAVIDLSKNQLAFNLLIKGFLFEKQLMQDHFNEEVMESDKFPKANFSGKIVNNNTLNIGKHRVHISGQLAMHGITKPLDADADIEVLPNEIKATCLFKVSYEDYNIKMPDILKNNISKTIAISVNVDCRPMANK